MAKVIIFGTGLIAEVACFYFTHDTDNQVVAFTCPKEFVDKDFFGGLPVIPFEEIEGSYPSSQYSMFVAIGYAKRNKIREQRCYESKQKGYRLETYISSRATYYDTPVGENCFILENNVIQPFTKIGDDVFLWSGNHVGHHTVIGDHSFISSHVVVSGACVIGRNCFLGVNSTLRDNIQIGDESIVGAGTLVMTALPKYSVLIGNATKLSEKTA